MVAEDRVDAVSTLLESYKLVQQRHAVWKYYSIYYQLLESTHYKEVSQFINVGRGGTTTTVLTAAGTQHSRYYEVGTLHSRHYEVGTLHSRYTTQQALHSRYTTQQAL